MENNVVEKTDKYEVILQWLISNGIPVEKINKTKLKRQISIITRWQENNGVGLLEAVTGFGKTWVIIFKIYLITRVHPHVRTNIVVPSLKLYNDWKQHIEDFDLPNCNVYVVNTYTAEGASWECELLALDECHHYASRDAKIFSKVLSITKFKMLSGVSATLEVDERHFFSDFGIPVIDRIGNAEARKMGYISDYATYNFGITLTDEEAQEYKRYDDVHNSNFGKFFYFSDRNSNWDLARACMIGNNNTARVILPGLGPVFKTGSEWRTWYAHEMGWDGDPEHEWSPKSINRYAQQWNWAMRERKKFLYQAPSKVGLAKEIIEYINAPTITFAENTDYADELSKALGKRSRAYHSNIPSETTMVKKTEYRKTLDAAKRIKVKLNGTLGNKDEKGYPIYYFKEQKTGKSKIKEETLRLFNEGKTVDVLCTAKALDEGFNVEGIRCALIASASSKQRQYIQRLGRALRFIEGKTALIINLYVKGTQDESWLKRRQKGEAGIKWIDDINQIEL